MEIIKVGYAIGYIVGIVVLAAGLSDKFGWDNAFFLSTGLALLLMVTR